MEIVALVLAVIATLEALAIGGLLFAAYLERQKLIERIMAPDYVAYRMGASADSGMTPVSDDREAQISAEWAALEARAAEFERNAGVTLVTG